MDRSGDQDTFSSLEDEFIVNVKRPSLISLTSEETSLESDVSVMEMDKSYDYSRGIFRSSTPHVGQNGMSPTNVTEYIKCGNYPLTRDKTLYPLSLYQDPSDNYVLNKSVSLRDISAIPEFNRLRRDSSVFSTETLHSTSAATTKSKDSGFQRSTSCSSLVSGVRKYDHVQSKVKQYIQNIKQTEALHKMQKQLKNNSNHMVDDPGCSPPGSDSIPVSKKELLNKVKELVEEIKEKDGMIEQLEKDHKDLRLKYAEAENKIDNLRIKVSCVDKKVEADSKYKLLPRNNNMCNRNPFEEIYGVKNTPFGYDLGKSVSHDSLSTVSHHNNNCLLDDAFMGSSSSKHNSSLQFHSTRRDNGEFLSPQLNPILKSVSCKYLADGIHHDIIRSPSNASFLSKSKKRTLNLPSDKNSFDKVQRWQKSLTSIDQPSVDQPIPTPNRHSYPFGQSLRHANNVNGDNILPSKSFDYGCCGKRGGSYKNVAFVDEEECLKEHRHNPSKKHANCPKKCCSRIDGPYRHRDQVADKFVAQLPKRKLMRSVSFASYEDSVTSSVYDDEDSSSNSSSTVFVPRYERYKEFKQRKLQERKCKQMEGVWGEVLRTSSSGSVSCARANKRSAEFKTGHSCHCCDKTKAAVKDCEKLKIRKVEKEGKVVPCVATAAAPAPVVKCKTVHVCENRTTFKSPDYDQSRISHSKSADLSKKKTDHKKRSSAECSCLKALEKLKIQEHSNLEKFSEHVKKHPKRTSKGETNTQKRHSTHKC